MTKGERAEAFFRQGCNCSQAVALAFCEETGLDEKLICRLTIGFGGGMGRMREVCGALSGVTFVLGAIYDEDRSSIYRRVQEIAAQFRKQNGSVVCRELLGLSQPGFDAPQAAPRTQEYYRKRPCPQIIHDTADLLAQYLENN